MWWFRATHANLLLLYEFFAQSGAAGRVLDAGCGTGGLLTRLTARLRNSSVVGLDADAFACARAAAKSSCPVCTGSVNSLPFADRSFDAVFSADVLCHEGVEEAAALAEFRRCLTDDGLLLLNLPAYEWMLSRHDRAVANVRRYDRNSVADLLSMAGFRVLFAGYWNAFLFPVMVLTRKLLPGGGDSASDVRLYPAPVEAACRGVTGLESLLLKRGIGLPFGGSLLAVAAKQEA